MSPNTDESEAYKYVFVNFVSGIWHHDGVLDPHGFPHQLAQGLGNGLEACFIDFKIIFTVMHLIETGCLKIQNI